MWRAKYFLSPYRVKVPFFGKSNQTRLIKNRQNVQKSARREAQKRGFQSAASRHAQRWMIQPKRKNQRIPEKTKKRMAGRRRPWMSCPRPGMRKLAREAITLPADPCPLFMAAGLPVDIPLSSPGLTGCLLKGIQPFKFWFFAFFFSHVASLLTGSSPSGPQSCTDHRAHRGLPPCSARPPLSKSRSLGFGPSCRSALHRDNALHHADWGSGQGIFCRWHNRPRDGHGGESGVPRTQRPGQGHRPRGLCFGNPCASGIDSAP